ncbi:MAG: uncharacterized membrane protein YsdA (DUF1294 family) [Psychroserpens sp.]|jgi:uncharacterized membrane protein YsdA (DUF1294 family)
MYIYLGLSLITYLIYALDKSKAQRGTWRISEGTLHFFALVGGWAGAALAQQYLRHKSSKREFRDVFWLTVIINMGVLIWLHTYSGAKYLALFH